MRDRLEGVLLMTLYFIIAVAAWFVPLRHDFDDKGANASNKGITHQPKRVAQVVAAAGDFGGSKSSAQSISLDRSPGANIDFSFCLRVSSLDRHCAFQTHLIRLAPDKTALELSRQVLHKIRPEQPDESRSHSSGNSVWRWVAMSGISAAVWSQSWY